MLYPSPCYVPLSQESSVDQVFNRVIRESLVSSPPPDFRAPLDCGMPLDCGVAELPPLYTHGQLMARPNVISLPSIFTYVSTGSTTGSSPLGSGRNPYITDYGYVPASPPKFVQAPSVPPDPSPPSLGAAVPISGMVVCPQKVAPGSRPAPKKRRNKLPPLSRRKKQCKNMPALELTPSSGGTSDLGAAPVTPDAIEEPLSDDGIVTFGEDFSAFASKHGSNEDLDSMMIFAGYRGSRA